MRTLFAIGVIVLLLGYVPALGNQIYWTTGFGESIERANLDGSGRETILSSANVTQGIALDVPSGHVYWAGVQGRGIGRANLGGSEATFLVFPEGDPYDIALDVGRGHMYWTESVWTNRIMRANLDGSDMETVIDVDAGYPQAVALDLVNSHMYWINIETSTIHRSNLDGTATVDVLTTGVSPIDLALDVEGGKVYWTENGRYNKSIRRANLDGSNIEDLVTTADVPLENPLGIALDLFERKVYWADHMALKIQRANLDGSQIEDVLTGLNDPHFIALDVIPEPTTALLLALGALAVFTRHRVRASSSVALVAHPCQRPPADS